jgi:hypothetical protein
LVCSTAEFTINNSSTCGSVFGFAKSTTYTSSSKTLVLPYTCCFLGLLSFNVHWMSNSTRCFDSYNGGQSNIIQTIPVDISTPAICYTRQMDCYLNVHQSGIDYLHFLLLDDQEQEIDFNNQHWHMTIQFRITKDVDRFHHEKTYNKVLANAYSDREHSYFGFST